MWAAIVYNVLLLSSGFLSVVWLLSFSEVRARNFLDKISAFALGAVCLLASSDKVWAKQPDADLIKGAECRTKRIIFIRHGESDWNEVFNRGFGPSFFVRLAKAIVREILLLWTCDSVFIDSPLSELGISQAQAMDKFLKSDDHSKRDEDLIALLNGSRGVDSSVVVCSNLRRALATCCVGLQARLQKTGERVLVLSALQEISRNIDANSLAHANSLPDLHACINAAWKGFNPLTVFETTLNAGNKPVFGSGLARMQAFNEWASNREEDTIVVCAGHSLWFRCFFQTYLPLSSTHEAKKKKLVNCGITSFDLSRAMYNGNPMYRIEPESIKVLYGGFK